MAPWLCSGSSGSLSSRAEKSIRRKRRADWKAGRGGHRRADSRTKALCRSGWSVEVSGLGLADAGGR